MALAVVALLAAGGFLALSLAPGPADVAHAGANANTHITKSGITISKSAATVAWGQNDTYTISLAAKPASYVIVSLDLRDQQDAKISVKPRS